VIRPAMTKLDAMVAAKKVLPPCMRVRAYTEQVLVGVEFNYQHRYSLQVPPRSAQQFWRHAKLRCCRALMSVVAGAGGGGAWWVKGAAAA
jgi:CRISPR-associated Cas5-like protein